MFCPIELGMTYAIKILSFTTIMFFVFQVEVFQFLKFHESEAKLTKATKLQENVDLNFASLFFLG